LLIYIPWWIIAPVVASLPVHDISLLKEICWYEENVDGLVAKSAWKAFSNHLWSLVVEIILLSLFSDVVTNEEKEEIVEEF